MNDDTEAKKLKTENETTPSMSTTEKQPIPTFIDDNLHDKKTCEYGEACYRQQNPLHTAHYDHPRK